MTPEEFEKAMQQIQDDNFSGDREVCHMLMEDLICNTLINLGYGDGINIFLDI